MRIPNSTTLIFVSLLMCRYVLHLHEMIIIVFGLYFIHISIVYECIVLSCIVQINLLLLFCQHFQQTYPQVPSIGSAAALRHQLQQQQDYLLVWISPWNPSLPGGSSSMLINRTLSEDQLQQKPAQNPGPGHSRARL